MGRPGPQDMEKLILGYEDLDPAEQALADSWLAESPGLAARLQWHQAKEAAAAAALPVVDDAWDGASLSPAEQAAQRESLRRLLALLEGDEGSECGGAGGPGRVRVLMGRLRNPAAWALPLAAVLAVVVLLPRGPVQPDRLRQLAIAPVALAPGGSRGAMPAGDGGVLHSGEAFSLAFTLEDDAYVVVYHVGPAGQVSLVQPAAITDSLSTLRGGQAHRIPGPDDEVWILGAETGVESFLVATAPTLPVGLDAITVDPGLTDRARILAELRSRLEERGAEVDLVEFRHVD